MVIISALLAKVLIGVILANAVGRTVNDVVQIAKPRSYGFLNGPHPLGYNSYVDTEEMKDVRQAIQIVKNAIAYMETNKKEMEPDMHGEVVGQLANLLQVSPSKVESMIEGNGADLSFLDRFKREHFKFGDGKAEDKKNKTPDQDAEDP